MLNARCYRFHVRARRCSFWCCLFNSIQAGHYKIVPIEPRVWLGKAVKIYFANKIFNRVCVVLQANGYISIIILYPVIKEKKRTDQMGQSGFSFNLFHN